jgi:hypothetical protein
VQVTGIVYIQVDGKQLRSKEGASMDPGGYERTPIMAADKLVGPAEKPVPAMVEATIAHTADTDLIEMSNWTGATLTFETDTGVSYLIANAFTTKPCKVTGGEGDVELEMCGEPALEQ